MITYYNHPHMTAVPTRLLLDTNLSAEAKLTGALLYTFEDGGLSAQELANALTLPPEKVAPVFAELTPSSVARRHRFLPGFPDSRCR